MAITKTDFINYIRCPRYVALEEIKKERLDADIGYNDYLEQEKEAKITELLSSIYNETETGQEIDLTNQVNEQLEAMLPYYKMVEMEAGRLTKEYFSGTSKYALETNEQESFDTLINGIRYKCYVDIYNETDKYNNIIEVKATTSNKLLKIGCNKEGIFNSIFKKVNNIYYLKEDIPGYNISDEFNDKLYKHQRNKLFDYYNDGKYIFDLAIQRYIIEHEFISSGNELQIDKMHYYLAVLNHQYIFDGTYENNKPVYNTNINGEDIIVFFDLTNITKEYQPIIDTLRKNLEISLTNADASPCLLGDYCQYKCQSKCKYFNLVCGNIIPKKNSSLNYIGVPQGFKDETGKTIKGLNLINEGYLNLTDIPESFLKRETNIIQRRCVENNDIYIDKEKIKKGLSLIKYPIFHLDFETFPCPMPRFFGERPYTQSPFEFSLHIESSPGVCDKNLDNKVFLADNFQDCRLELVKKLIEWTGNQEGTLFAQNVSFEKSRIFELANIFPEYKAPLMKLYNNGFDLLWLINTNSSMYEKLGFDENRAKTCNYYHPLLNGSFSIKKTLPLFSDLSYQDLDVKNGTEAIITYANYNKMDPYEFKLKYESLIKYCKQDTWAMVVILEGLRQLSK